LYQRPCNDHVWPIRSQSAFPVTAYALMSHARKHSVQQNERTRRHRLITLQIHPARRRPTLPTYTLNFSQRRRHAFTDTRLRLRLPHVLFFAIHARPRIRLDLEAFHSRADQSTRCPSPSPPPPLVPLSAQIYYQVRSISACAESAACMGGVRSGAPQCGQRQYGGCRAQRTKPMTRPHDEQMGVYSDFACLRATMGYSSSSKLNEVMG
jgi:hypothetical protein